MKRQISLADFAISIVMSVFPVLGPRVDLLKDCLLAGSVLQLVVCQPEDSWRRTAGFWIGNAALLTIFLPENGEERGVSRRRNFGWRWLPAFG